MTEARFAWQGRDRNGRTLHGYMLAPTRAAVEQQLQQQRIRPMRVRRQWWRYRWLHRKPVVRERHITQLTRQLATLLRAGVPLLQALDIMHQSTCHSSVKALLQELRLQLENGTSLHQALRQQRAFDGLFCHLVAAGELAGMLDTVLERLALHREKTENLRHTLRSALVYPTVVVVIAFVVMALLLSFVVPAFQNIFSSFGAELPALTRAVITLSAVWQQHAAWLLLLTAVLIWRLPRVLSQHPKLLSHAHAWILRLPMLGMFTRAACQARWTRTLATLFGAGVPLAEALEAIQGVTGNLHYQAATQSVQTELMRGSSLARALAEHAALFSPMVVQMSAIGEESGTLDQMLNKTAEHYEREVDTMASQFATLLEPAIMVVLGVLIGGLVMALYLPIFQMGQVV